VVSAIILVGGLFVSFRIIRILRNYNLGRPWIILSSFIFFFLFGYGYIALRFLGINLISGLSIENLMTVIFLFSAIFVVTLSVLNLNLMRNVFGSGISDAEALNKFAQYVHMPVRKVRALAKRDYAVNCDACNMAVHYSIPNVVRAHPQIERGVVVDKGMGITSYRLYVRHFCGNGFREIPVSHDHKLEYRAKRPSRLV
jgi:hypothetical protein